MKLKTLEVSELKFGFNPRAAKMMTASALADMVADIAANGLQEPIMVALTEGGHEVLKGNRRGKAIGILAETNPSKYRELFPQGVPCLVHTGLSESEIMNLKVDDGNKVPLADPWEVMKGALGLLDVGTTEKDIAVKLAAMLDRVNPMSTENRSKLEALRAEKAEAEKLGLVLQAGNKQSEIETFLLNNRKGWIQNVKQVHRLPPVVAACFEARCEGKNPEGYEGRTLPTLTFKQCAGLAKKFLEDLSNLDDRGLPKFSKNSPGPAFTEAFSKLENAPTKGAAEPTAKAMPRQDIVKEAEGKVFGCELATELALRHAGDPRRDVNRLAKYAHISKVAETLEARDPEFWAMCVARYEEVIRA